MNNINIEHIALEASAGTGKTFQLALRVTELLLKGVQPKNILCLTFTKKATAEMKDRIIENIINFADNKFDKESAEYKLILDKMKVFANKLKVKKSIDEFIIEQATNARNTIFQSYSDLNIKTIDSFVSSILKMFPYEAGIRPDFNIQSEDSHEIIFNEIFNNVFANLIENPNWKEIFNNIPLAFEDNFLSFFNKTKDYLNFVYTNYIVLKKKIDYVSDTNSDIENLIKLINDTKKIKKNIITYTRKYAKTMDASNKGAINALNTLNNYTKIYDLISNKYIYNGYRSHSYFKKVTFSDDHEDVHDELKKEIKKYLVNKANILEKYILLISKKLINEITEAKNKINQFTFSDLTTLTSNMMNSKLVNTDYLYFRLDAKINHILIDEFQDTSVAQWKILEPLIEESISGIGQKDKSGSFFYVGDPKQNIYRFRGGSSSLFKSVYNIYKDYISYKTLGRNFRSGKNIVEFVNKLFTEISTEKKSNLSKETTDYFKSQLDSYVLNQEHDSKKGNGYVKFKISKEKKSDEVINNYSLECINEAVDNGWTYKEIAILVNTNSDGDTIYEYLLENNIPVKRETSSYLINTIEYNALMDLAKFIETGNEISFLKFITAPNPIISLNEYKNEELINNIKKDIYSKIIYYGKKPIFEKILLLVQDLNLQHRFSGKQDLLNTLDIMASTCPNEYNFVTFKETLDEIVSSVQSVSVKESNAVTIMTIHKSKGLQFPVIILPNIKRDLKLKKIKSDFILTNPDDTDTSDLVYVYNQNEIDYVKDTDRYTQLDKENIRIFIDAINFLYVAMTRAEQVLFMQIYQPSDTTMDKILNSEITSNDLSDLSDYIYYIVEIKRKIKVFDNDSIKPIKDVIHSKNNIIPTINHEKYYDLPITPLLPKFKRDKFIKQNFEGQMYGTALHDGLRFLDGNNRKSIDIAINKIKNEYELFLDQNSLNEIKSYLENIFNNEVWLKMFKGQVFKERSVGRTVGKTKELYAIDAYSIIDNKKIILCDYKTGKMDAYIDDYKVQVLNYALILKELYNISDIEQYLINFHNGKIEAKRINEEIII